jgi:hypothetical protein
MTPRDKCLAAALHRQTNGDCSWMFGLDDIATQRRREKVLLAVLTRLVCIADCAPPVESKPNAPPCASTDAKLDRDLLAQLLRYVAVELLLPGRATLAPPLVQQRNELVWPHASVNVVDQSRQGRLAAAPNQFGSLPRVRHRRQLACAVNFT